MKKAQKIAINGARVLLGGFFVFSGFVKAIDPLGGSYKLSDYFEAFGLMPLMDISGLFAVLLAAFEFFLGTALILGLWRKSTSFLVLLFMLLATSFTLYLVWKHPVTDCGCFGDAWVLTNTQTFYKNVVLLLLAVPVFVWNNLFVTFFGRRTERWSIYWCMFFPLLLSVHCYRHLPLLDFRPYKVGNYLPDLMDAPAGAPKDSFDVRFVYERKGVRKSFTAETAPLNDSSWVFVDRELTLIRKGFEPPIRDFYMEHPSRGDITGEVLSDTSYTFLLVSPNLVTANRGTMDRMVSVYRYARRFGYAFYGLTGSDFQAVDEWNYEYDVDMDFCTMDDRTLRTMIRSNPGLMLLKGGTVIQKWGFRDIPDLTRLREPLSRIGKDKADDAVVEGLGKVFLLWCIPLLCFYLLHKGYCLHFHWKRQKEQLEKNRFNT